MVERLKSIAIVALFLSLILLLGLSFSLGVYGGQGPLQLVAGLFAGGDGGDTAEAALSPQPAAWPGRVAVVQEGGIFAAVTADEYSELYSHSGRVRRVYQEALGSSGEPQAIDGAAFMDMLAAPAIYLGFDTALPLWLHYGWVEGEGAKPDLPVETVVVGVWDGAVALAFATGQGTYYRMATGTSVQDLEAACAQDFAANSVLAATSPLYSGLVPYALVYTGAQGGGFVTLPDYRLVLSTYTDEGRLTRQLLEAFSLRYYLSTPTVSASGALRYVDGPSELTAHADGALQLVRSAREEPVIQGVEPGSPAECIQVVEYARALVEGVWQASESSGQLSLEVLEYDPESRAYTLGFELRIGGYYVQTPRRPAYVRVEDGYLAAASVIPFTMAADEATAIAYPQYAAAVWGAGDGRMGICYIWEPWAAAGREADALLRPQVSLGLGD